MTLDEEAEWWKKQALQTESGAWLIAFGVAQGLLEQKAKIERLEAALREIADAVTFSDEAYDLQKRARAALEDNVSAKAREIFDAERKVELFRFLELDLLLLGEHRVAELVGLDG